MTFMSHQVSPAQHVVSGPGYRISIHPDSARKAITTQYDLPVDESQGHLGRRFHEKKSDGSYTEARAMRFAPNTGDAFAVSPHSYHSVDTIGTQDKPRNCLMVMFNHDRGALLEGCKTGRAHVRS